MNVFLVYQHEPLSVESTKSVPRLMALLASQLLKSNVDVQILSNFISPDFPQNQLFVSRSLFSKFINYFKILNRFKRFRDLEFYIKVDKAINKFNRNFKIKSDSFKIITVSYHHIDYLLRKYDHSKLIYWIHNAPNDSIKPIFQNIVASNISIVVPGLELYKHVWDNYYQNGVFPYFFVINNVLTPCSFVLKNIIDDYDSSNVYILYAGGYSPHKGFHVIRKSLEKLKSSNKTIYLISIGKKVKENIAENIIHVGLVHLDRKSFYSIINYMDFALIPSLWFENYPITLLEFKLFNKPVICSDSGSMPQMIDSNNSIVVSNANLVYEWSNAIDIMINKNINRNTFDSISIQPNNEFIEKWLSVINFN